MLFLWFWLIGWSALALPLAIALLRGWAPRSVRRRTTPWGIRVRDQDEVLAFFAKQADAATEGGRVGIGRPHPGAGGVVHSYEEALNALDLADRLHIDEPVLRAADLLVYPVLTRDRQAMADLVRTTLGPLRSARGGPQPLVETLTAYFDSGCVAAEAARLLSLSVRAFTHRLERIHKLTGADRRTGSPLHASNGGDRGPAPGLAGQRPVRDSGRPMRRQVLPDLP